MELFSYLPGALSYWKARQANVGRSLLKGAAVALVGLASLTTLPSIAFAEYPNKVIEIVVPFAPGGGTDTISRILAQEMSKDLGQSLIIDNRPGASTMIGSKIVADSAPDGYKLLMASFAHAVNPYMNANIKYDTATAFAPVALVAKSYNILVVKADSPFKTVQDLVTYAKANPGVLNYGSFGNGTSAHLSAELFKYLTRSDITHISYKGAAPALTDLLAGQVQMVFTSVASVTGHIAAGTLRPLAVTSFERSAAFPDIPTLAEAGVPGYVSDAWYGLYAPVGTPPEVISKLNISVEKAIRSEAFKKLEKMEGLVFVPGTPEDLKAFVDSQGARWKEVISAQGIKAD
ncbi:tripartite tricarboxylate transporter substrate binding protein [Agrobacterium sp. LAD9]|uniref:Bug family tripartite tricarboxylate transporter substrate binding protein n=1 Tax=Agrobacterium sp. LAD9 TaxID=2055153 RepID=UPI000D1FAC63|nr:tripartite tricarboxylate transporter substrate binding protein [Agrobacterium sp. LAD9]